MYIKKPGRRSNQRRGSLTALLRLSPHPPRRLSGIPPGGGALERAYFYTHTHTRTHAHTHIGTRAALKSAQGLAGNTLGDLNALLRQKRMPRSGLPPPPSPPIYLLYWYTSTNTARSGDLSALLAALDAPEALLRRY